MRYIPIKNVKAGMVLGKPLFDTYGTKLLAQNQIITDEYIERIVSLGYPGLYIEDELSKDIEITDTISQQLKYSTVGSLKNIFVTSPDTNPAAYRDEFNFLSENLMSILDELISNKELMVNMVDLKIYDDYTYFHSVNVAILSLIVGNALQLKKDMLTQLGMAALLHDIGKKFIDIDILGKPGELNDEEFSIIKQHPKNGFDFLKNNFPTISSTTRLGILQHHERFNGSGYPRGVSGTDISIFGRILAVCDVYDALISDRPYHKAYLPSDALEFIQGGSGTMFDPHVVFAFARKIATFPIGTAVTLSNGEIGIVVENYEEFNLRPKLKIIKNNVVSHYLNLKSDAAARNITITGIAEY